MSELRKILKELIKDVTGITPDELSDKEKLDQAGQQIKDLMLSEKEIDKIIDSFLIEGEGIDSGEIAKAIIQASEEK